MRKDMSIKIPASILDGTSTYLEAVRWQIAQHKQNIIHTYNYNGWWSEEIFNALENKSIATYDLQTSDGVFYKRLYILPAGHDLARFEGCTQFTWVTFRDGECAWHKMNGSRCDIYAI